MVFAALQVLGRPGAPRGWVQARPRAGSSRGNPVSGEALLGKWAAGLAIPGHVPPPVPHQQAVPERGGGRTSGHRLRAGRPGFSPEQPGGEAGGVGAHGHAGEERLQSGAGVRVERRGWAPPDSSSPQDSLTTIPELKDHLRIFRWVWIQPWQPCWRGAQCGERMGGREVACPEPPATPSGPGN